MQMDSVSLARQVEFVFRQLEGELTNATAGTVLINIRNNAVGKFGVKHHPIESKNGKLESMDKGLTALQVQAFKQLAIESLKYRKDWTHGEILYDFSVRSSANSWSASVLFESNYNMANWNSRYYPKRNDLWDSH
ncbi:O-methyltransferase [Paenibacillus sp. FSL H8-0548]|uniref:O-methyltransferase n=1 Tax=Paenibacillus sp. FSL H8-0548 TaxID=1920422 RepID=UPI00096CA53A|nr:O-methyltransferase [Paenibacillus sp. FSL H8-0548]OMF22219.1 O-methyltransferase [Paenibacillus sp. FSL H8-0548]